MSQQLFVQNTQTGPNTSCTLTGVGKTTQFFPPALNKSIGVQSTAIGYVAVPGSNAANCRQFAVRATGNFEVGSGGGCPAFTLGLYLVSFANAASVGVIGATPVASVTSTAQNSYGTFYPWALKVNLAGSNGAGFIQILSGGWLCVDGVNATVSAGLTTGNGFNFANPVPVGFAVGVSFNPFEPGNNTTLTQFALTL
jgi:hypothetical protein